MACSPLAHKKNENDEIKTIQESQIAWEKLNSQKTNVELSKNKNKNFQTIELLKPTLVDIPQSKFSQISLTEADTIISIKDIFPGTSPISSYSHLIQFKIPATKGIDRFILELSLDLEKFSKSYFLFEPYPLFFNQRGVLLLPTILPNKAINLNNKKIILKKYSFKAHEAGIYSIVFITPNLQQIDQEKSPVNSNTENISIIRNPLGNFSYRILSEEYFDLTEKNLPTNDIQKTLATSKALRTCQEYDDQEIITKSLSFEIAPAKEIYRKTTVMPLEDKCLIKISESHQQTRICLIPFFLNSLIQDTFAPFMNLPFQMELIKIQNKMNKAKSIEEYKEQEFQLQHLWQDYFSLALQTMEELDFHFPNKENLTSKYCQILPLSGDGELISWWKSEQDNMALKTATTLFKLKGPIPSVTNSSEESIQTLQAENILKDSSCLQKKDIANCEELAEKEKNQSHFVNAAKIYAHSCSSLNNKKHCQPAALNFFLGNELEKAQEYDLLACQLKNATSCYNLACSYCLKDLPDQSLIFFKKALEIGIDFEQEILNDPTIRCLEKTSEFIQFKNKTLGH